MEEIKSEDLEVELEEKTEVKKSSKKIEKDLQLSPCDGCKYKNNTKSCMSCIHFNEV